MHCSHFAYCIQTGTYLFLPWNRHHFVLSYCCMFYVRKVIRMNSESLLHSELTISSYFISWCLGVRVLGSKPNQSSRPGNSNTDSSLHVVLQAFVYKIAKPREATNILDYQIKYQPRNGNQRQSINKVIWYAVEINQQSHIVRSGKKLTKSYCTQWKEINKVILYSAEKNQQIHWTRAWRAWRSRCWHLVRRCLLYTSDAADE